MADSRKYWKEHWSSHSKLENADPQIQIARTKSGVSISEADWKMTCEHIIQQIQPQTTDKLLDLCCGNGLLTKYLINYVDEIIAIDYSEKLLDSFMVKHTRVVKILCDALEFNYDEYRFDHVIMYFAAQHFSESELTLLVKKVFKSIKRNGLFLIGDVPDIARKWDFYSNSNYRNSYFSALEQGQESIGTWYDRRFFEFLSHYIGFEAVEIQEQPNFMINNNHRFDVLLRK